ncbi:phosphohistidine phosphatase [Salinispora sp. H7-4]|nr:phosphohistidine phosphatase [Salinispora sp. H7-4]
MWPLLVALASAGTVVHVLDRWRYRHRPALDVAQLAQQVSAEAVAQSRAELGEAYADAAAARKEARSAWAEATSLRLELAEAREELGAARVEIARLTAALSTVRSSSAG